eukprot:RCo026196
MAPEALMYGRFVEGSDVWSVACTVLEMVEGLPWMELNATNDAQVVWGIARELVPKIPEALSAPARAFLRRCFLVDPEQRPSCGALLRDPFLATAPLVRSSALGKPGAVPLAVKGPRRSG